MYANVKNKVTYDGGYYKPDFQMRKTFRTFNVVYALGKKIINTTKNSETIYVY